jgi:hypothetical protein
MNRALHRALVGCGALFFALACKREAPSGAVPATSAGSAQAAAAPSAAPSAARPWYAGSWAGTYDAGLTPAEAAPGALREWAKDDGKAASGKGTLELTIDDHGLASGQANGPLGAHAVNGSADADTLRLALAPKEVDDLKAFRGAVVVKRDGDVLRGTLRAGSGDGVTLRQANLELRRKPPP